MRFLKLAAGGSLILLPAVALAGTGVYPYLKNHYEYGYLVQSSDNGGVTFEHHKGAFYSKHQRQWQSDIVSVYARNTTKQPKCIRVTFKAFGTSLDWASSWGNNEIFYLKKGQTLQNFAGLTSDGTKYGFNNFSTQVWDPVAKKKCGEPRA